jgi:PKHD-type hydroxylase
MFLCSTRKGLFLDETKVQDGKFFGFTRDGKGGWYIFGHKSPDVHIPTMQGFIAHFEIHDGKVTEWKEVLSGLDNGVHQIMFYKEHLYILESYIQRITRVCVKTWKREIIKPLPDAISSWYVVNGLEGSFEEYVHMNALTVQDDRFYIMCPQLRNKIENGQPTQNRNPSIIKMFSSDWKPIDEFDTGKYFCHDLVILGHEIYFADAANTICKINTVTREVSEVWTVDPVSPDLRKICRGLSIGEDGTVLVGTHDFNGNSFLVNVLENKHIQIASPPCCIKRLDVFDFNDETCPLRMSQIVCTRNSITEAVYPELVKVLEENPGESTELGDLTSFLNPNFKIDRENFGPGKNHTSLENIDVLEKQLPPSLVESGRFYLYPKGHGMGWHTNKDNIIIDDGQRNYRMYTVHTTGESYFLYRHTVSKKIHAVRDVDGTSLIFNLMIDSEPFWHAVMCKAGARLSYGVKFGKDILDGMLDEEDGSNICSRAEEDVLTFKYSKVNKNITNYFKIEKGFSTELCNDIRIRLQDVPLIDGITGSGIVNAGIRVSKVYWLPKTQKFLDVYSILFKMVGQVNEIFFNFQLESIDSKVQYTVYEETSRGHYGWHMDVGSFNSRRKLSVIVQLSDPSEYEGGELQIQTGLENPVNVEKDKGTVIIFPSYLTHQVTPVTKGTRRTLVLWVEGPPFN